MPHIAVIDSNRMKRVSTSDRWRYCRADITLTTLGKSTVRAINKTATVRTSARIPLYEFRQAAVVLQRWLVIGHQVCRLNLLRLRSLILNCRPCGFVFHCVRSSVVIIF